MCEGDVRLTIWKEILIHYKLHWHNQTDAQFYADQRLSLQAFGENIVLEVFRKPSRSLNEKLKIQSLPRLFVVISKQYDFQEDPLAIWSSHSQTCFLLLRALTCWIIFNADVCFSFGQEIVGTFAKDISDGTELKSLCWGGWGGGSCCWCDKLCLLRSLFCWISGCRDHILKIEEHLKELPTYIRRWIGSQFFVCLFL